MLHKGSCHCGAVAYTVEGDIGEVIDCNCSICRRKGALLWFVPRDALKMASPESALSSYRFNRHLIDHQFCSVCGIHPFATALAPDGRPMAAINVRCLEDVELSALKVVPFDGKNV